MAALPVLKWSKIHINQNRSLIASFPCSHPAIRFPLLLDKNSDFLSKYIKDLHNLVPDFFNFIFYHSHLWLVSCQSHWPPCSSLNILSVLHQPQDTCTMLFPYLECSFISYQLDSLLYLIQSSTQMLHSQVDFSWFTWLKEPLCYTLSLYLTLLQNALC